MSAKTLLALATWALAVAPVTLACGSGDSARSPSRSDDADASPDPPACTQGKCCPDIEWMLVSPAKSSIGGQVDLDASVKRQEGRPHTVRWTVEGGGVRAADTTRARYTCSKTGVFVVNFSVANAFCETSQEAHIQCAE